MAQHRTSGAKDLLITYLKSEGSFLKFWALPLTALEAVKRLEAHFKERSAELESSRGFLRSEDIPVGIKCVVKSNIKHMWCRARVIAHRGISSVVVQLMDYGNEEVISVTNIRCVNDHMFSAPPQAVECIMADVLPTRGNEWLPEAIKFCEQNLLYETLSCYVVAECMNLPVVRVAKKGENQAFVQRLINSGLAFYKHETTSPPVLSYKMNNMDQNTIHLVKVSCVESIRRFYVQLSAAEMELKHLMDSLNSIPRESLQLLKIANINTPCLAQLLISQKPCYYRAIITFVQQTLCKVFFVDYGFLESKDFHDLRAIPPEFLSLPAQAIRCSLPSDVDIDTAEFRHRSSIGHLECHVLKRTSDESYIVKLLHHGQDLLQPSLKYVEQRLNVGTPCDIKISYINDLTEFYCQLLHYKEHQNNISSILNSGYKFNPISLSECMPNKPVCVKFSDDDMWYRAKILKVNSEHDIEVFFVDFGNCDNVNINDIRKISTELLKYPVQAFKCYLFETLLPSESKAKDDAYDLFEKLTTDECLVAHIKAFTEESGYGVILYEKNSKLSINQKLQSIAISVQTVSFNDVENVYVTSFEQTCSFFVQFEKLGSDILEQMQEEINLFYSSLQNLSFIPIEGSLVCARFEDDGQFYRAKVEKVNDGFCNVFFIDYGNRESISVKDIHPIDLNFVKYPQFGCECAFENCPSGIPKDKLSSLMLEKSIQVKKIKEENGKCFITLTEKFPGNVAILELFRQYENKKPRSIHGAGLGGFQEKPFRKDNLRVSPTDSWDNENISQRNNSGGLGGFQEKSFRKDNSRVSPTESWNNANISQRNNNYQSSGEIRENTPSPVTSSALTEAENFQDFGCISIPPKACRNVYVSHVISPSEFYCQVEEDNAKLLQLSKILEDTYTIVDDNELNFSKFTVDAPCCAEFQKDGAWYRGKIKKINSDSCDIFFVDYGNTDAVPNSKIKKLKSNLMRLPSQAIYCKSFNISPAGKEWNDAEINAFIKMTLEKSFVAQFVECDSNGVYAVNLVSIGKLEEDIFNKEFVGLGFGRLQDAKKCLVLNSHAASSNLTFSTIDVKIGSSEAVRVFYGLNPSEIFCQLKSTENEFIQMMVNLQDYYNNISDTEALIDRPHNGMICVAKFLLDSAWYRAKIEKIEMNKITVLYVDYGNSESIDRKNIRFIIQDYALLPVQALKCRIRGIKPPGNAWTVTDNLSKYFEGDAVCTFISKEGDSYLVDMICNGKNVAQLLISDKIAVSDGSENVQIHQPKAKSTDLLSNLPKREDAFVVGQLVSVIVSYIESPLKFWCQLVDESDTLNQLMSDIDAQYQSSEISVVDSSSISVGSYCMAQYFEDEAWYRAQVQSCHPKNTYKVFFVDYGNSEIVSISQIKAIIPQFLKFPAQCIECCLQNSPPNPTDEMISVFRSSVEEAEEITAKIEKAGSNNYTVSLLYDKDDDEINISELLFGLTEDNSKNAAIVEAPRFLPPDVPLGLHEGYVSVVNTPQDFYIQLTESEDALAQLSVELGTICEKSAEEDLYNICIGAAYAAKYSEDNNWYRAEVTCVHDSTVDVLFVDYGNVDTIEKKMLKSLSVKHLQMAPLAIKCKLNGIIPAAEEWSKEAITTFQEMVLESCLGITFISKDIPAVVNIAKDDKEIAQCLVDMELANVETSAETDEAYAEDHLAPPVDDPLSSLPSDQSYPVRKLRSSKLLVKICYVDSYDKFYVMPLELSTELDTVMTTLELLYSADKTESSDSNTTLPEILEDPKALMPCVAKYSEDNAWYRAAITDVDGDNIYVSFVDYGNSEVTTLANLRAITPELVKIPPIAMECSLFGIEAIPKQEQEITAKLEEFFIDEVELEMEICEFQPYKIKLNHDGDVASMLINEGIAKEKAITPIKSETIETFVDSSKITFVDEPLEYGVQIAKRFFTNINKIVGNVKFCELENNMIVFHVVLTDLEDELQNLQQKLQEAYSEAPNNLSSVSSMDFCAAKYMEDENWYRAQVLSCDKEKIKVRFIDYGNCETVDISDIYELLPDFTNEPQFSVKCILSGLEVNKSKEVELQNTLDEYVYHESVELKLCEYSHAVCDLCVTNVICGETNISELILNERLVSQQYLSNIRLNDRFKAKVKNILNKDIYVLPIDFEFKWQTFQHKLQEICSGINNANSEIVSNYLYAVKIHDTWYRASVTNVLDNTVEVHLVDIGSVEEVNKSELILLPCNMNHQPLFLQMCTIEENNDSSCNLEKNLHVDDLVLCEVQKRYAVHEKPSIKILKIVEDIIGDESVIADDSTEFIEIEKNIPSKDDADELQIDKDNEMIEDASDVVENTVVNDFIPANEDFDDNIAPNEESVTSTEIIETETGIINEGDAGEKQFDKSLTEGALDIIERTVVGDFVKAKEDFDDKIVSNEGVTSAEIIETMENVNKDDADEQRIAESYQVIEDALNVIENTVVDDFIEAKENFDEHIVSDKESVRSSEIIETKEKVKKDIGEQQIVESYRVTEDAINVIGNTVVDDFIEAGEDFDENIVSNEESVTGAEIMETKENINKDDADEQRIAESYQVIENVLNVIENAVVDDFIEAKEDFDEHIVSDKESVKSSEIIETKEKVKKDIGEQQIAESYRVTEDAINVIGNTVVDDFIEAGEDFDENIVSNEESVNSAEVMETKENIKEGDADEQQIAENYQATDDSVNVIGSTFKKADDFIEAKKDFDEHIVSDEESVAVCKVEESVSTNENFSEEKESEFHTLVTNTCEPENEVNEEIRYNKGYDLGESTDVDETVNANNEKVGLNYVMNLEVNLENTRVNDGAMKNETVCPEIDVHGEYEDEEHVLPECETVSNTEIFESDDDFDKKLLSESEGSPSKTEISNSESDVYNKNESEDNVSELSKNESFDALEEYNIPCGTYVETTCEAPQTKENLDQSLNPCGDHEKNKSTIEDFEDSLEELQVVSDNCKGNGDFDDSDITSIVKSLNMDEIQKDFEESEDDIHTSETKTVDLNTKILNTSLKSGNRLKIQDDEANEDMQFSSSTKGGVLYAESFDMQGQTSHLVENSSNFDKGCSESIQESVHLSGSVEVKVTNIDISDDVITFAAQPIYLQQELTLLKDLMHSKYSSDNFCHDKCSESSFCAVYHENEWCRGKILENGEDECTVLLVDYGKYISVESSVVKSLNPEFYNKPCFAVWCTFPGVVCLPERNESAIEFLWNLLKDKSAVVKILEDYEPFKSNLYVDDLDVLNCLLKANLVMQKLPNINLEPGSYKAKFLFLHTNSERLEIFVCLSSFIHDYTTLTENMQTMYTVENTVSCVSESGIYAAFHDSIWYRGLVLSNSDVTQIYLVDYGKTITGCTNLHYLLPEHCLQPAFALPCHTPFLNFSDKISDCLKILEGAEFLVQVEADSDTMSVTLTDEHIMNKLKELELKIDGFNECSTNQYNSGEKNLSSSDDSSKTVNTQKQESSMQIVGFLEETFTTKPL